MKSQTRGTLEMISAMVISGTVGWFVIVSGQSPEAVVFWRCLFGAMAMLVTCLVLGGAAPLPDHRPAVHSGVPGRGGADP